MERPRFEAVNRVGDRHAGDRPGRRVRIVGVPSGPNFDGPATDPAGGLSVLHVVVKAGPTNSQYNEHCLPVMRERRITVCSLFPAEVEPPPEIVLVQGDGSLRGCFRALREALARSTYDACTCTPPAAPYSRWRST